MVMGAPTAMITAQRPMPIDPRLLTLTQWLSPSYPIGAFAYSHGIEYAIQAGWIEDADGLESWLRDCLTAGSGRVDAIWVRLGYASADPLPLNAQARAFAASAERVKEAERQGTAFVKTTNAVWGLDLPDLLLPIAVGRAAGAIDLDQEACVTLYLQAFCTNLISAALRLMPLGQTEAQAILARLQPDCISVARATQDCGIDDIYSNTFLSDIASMRHETQDPRLFQT